MKNYLFVILATIFVALAIPASSQDFGPDLGVLSKVFGYNNQLGTDCSFPNEYSVNPAAMIEAIPYNNGKGYVEVDSGRYDFSDGPEVNTTWIYAVKPIGLTQAVRLGFYASSSAPTLSKLGVNVGVSCLSGEFAYAKRISSGVVLGVSIAPEIAETKVWDGDYLLAKGVTKLNPNIRLGVTWKPFYWMMVGGVTTLDDFKTVTTLYDSDRVAIGESCGNYKQRLTTLGVSAMLRWGTYVSLNHQFGMLKGPGLDENVSLTSIALNQFITENLSFTYIYQDHGNDFSLQYRDKEWCGGVSLGNNAYRQLAPYFGTAKTRFLWIGKSF